MLVAVSGSRQRASVLLEDDGHSVSSADLVELLNGSREILCGVGFHDDHEMNCLIRATEEPVGRGLRSR